MKIKRISITGFGRFTNWEHDLSDGLNVIYGLNESGKTTLHRFILGMLYGFKEPNHSRRNWRDEHALYEPWSGAPYQGALEFYGADGRCYRVERQFAKDRDTVRVLDALTGEDLTGEYPLDKRRELLFAEAHTGMNELIFISTACIGELPGDTGNKGLNELGARLANLQESGEEATSLHKAATKLEDLRKAQNSRRNKAAARYEKAQKLWQEMSDHRSAARQLEQELSDLQVATRQLQVKREEAEASLLAADIEFVQTRLAKAEGLASRVDQLNQTAVNLVAYADFPVDSRDEVKEELVLLEQGEQVITEHNQQLALVVQELQQAHQQINALPGAVAYKSQDDWNTASTQIRDGQVRWEQMITDLNNAKERWTQAEVAADSAATALEIYAGLAQLPDDAPRILDEMAAVNREANVLAQTLNACTVRARKLQEQVGQYMRDVQDNAEQIACYAHWIELPAHVGELMQGWVNEAQALTQAATGLLEANRSDIEQGDKAQKRLDSLEKVKVAGEEKLNAAERIVEQEKAARLRAEAADTQAEAVVLPPTSKLVSGWLLLLGGILSGYMAAFVVEWPVAFWVLAVALMLSGMVTLITWQRVRNVRQQEKQHWYNTKGEARAVAAKLGAEIHDMATAVGQPSIPAWQDAWRTVVACQKDVERAQAASASVQNLLYQRQQYTEKVLAALAQVGMATSIEWNPGTWELPWTADDIQRFHAELANLSNIQQERQSLPQRMAELPNDVAQLVGEVERLEDSCRQLHARLANSIPEPMEQSIAVSQIAAAQTLTAGHNGLLEQWTALPADMHSAAVTQAVSQLPSLAELTSLANMLTAVEQIAESVEGNMISLSGADDAAGFTQQWQEYQQARQEAKQAQEKVSMLTEAYDNDLQQCRQFLASVIRPLVSAVELPLPSAPEKTTAELISAWADTINQAVERIHNGSKLIVRITELQVTYHGTQKAIDSKKQEQQLRQENLNRLFSAAGVSDATEYEKGWAQKQQYDATVTEIVSTRRELEGILGENTIAELGAHLQELCREKESLPMAQPPQDRSVVQEALQNLDEELASIKQKMIVADNEIKNHLKACAGEEELAAELEKAGEERAVASLVTAAAQLAREQLDLAADEVHRQLAPALNTRASAILAELTNGRYSQLVVDRHIAIQVLDQRFSRQVAMDAVSRGTADQLYLAFRLAAAEVVSQGRARPPLLVDDAFAHYDDERAHEGLHTMLQLAQLTQVILFTCRQRDMRLLEELSQLKQAPIQIIKLPAPA